MTGQNNVTQTHEAQPLSITYNILFTPVPEEKLIAIEYEIATPAQYKGRVVFGCKLSIAECETFVQHITGAIDKMKNPQPPEPANPA